MLNRTFEKTAVIPGSCLAVLCWLSGSLPTEAAEPTRSPDFNTEIRPILSENCYYCHGPDADNRKADLRLDDRRSALESLAIVPGKPEESELISRLESTDPELVMPPPHANRTITPRQKELLKEWIAAGADFQEHWAFKPLTDIPLPRIAGMPEAELNPVDAFVLEQLHARNLKLSPPARKETLIRRITFDLTGLPPTLEQIDAFVADASPDAVEDLVDRLFASEHYGERMTSEWLDVARYSDSYGYQVDRDRFVWPWRDWVVRAFNRNMPYDQFITEQLAGDLLPNATDDQILATTFNRLHPHNVEGGSVAEEFRVEHIADRTQTYGTAFLGLTLECARCHSHKYDPFSQTEYYQLSAFFDNIDEAGLISFFTDAIPTPTLLLASEEQKRQRADLEAKIAAAEQQLEQLNSRDTEHFRDWLKSRRNEQTKPATESPWKPSDPAATGQDQPPAHPLIPGRIAELTFENFDAGPNKLVPGRFGQSIQLTGDDAVPLKVGNFKRYEPFSISLWLNTPDVKERAVVFHRSRAWTDAASRGYELLIEEGRLSAALIHFWPGNAIRVQTRDAIPTGTWLHVVLTYDGSSQAKGLRLFLNGQPAECEIVRDQLTKNITGGGGDNIALGERFRDRGFKQGLIDEFQVYQRELTSLEIEHLHDGDALSLALTAPIEKLSTGQVSSLREWYHATQDPEARTAREALQALRKQRSELVDPIPEIMVMRETPEQVPSHLLVRGVYDAKGPEVQPGTPAQLNPFPAEAPSNRLGLARWTTSPENPLTARVTVNRYWQMLFGEGLVRTPEDFGSQGQPPTHPRLLDWLAKDFIDHGWNVRHLLKQILLSQTYQQSSAVTPDLLTRDPENRLLTRFPRRRLPAEMLRDAALANSGLLVPKLGGPYVKPYEVEASFKPSPRSQGENLYRRSLYTYWKRNAPAPVMLALDANIRDVCRVKREKTMSPLQAFVLLNGPQFVEASRVLAERLMKQHGTIKDSTLVDLFRQLTARQPSPEELHILKTLFASERSRFQQQPEEAAALLAVGDRPVDATLDASQLAALAIVVNTLFNFDETQMQQ